MNVDPCVETKGPALEQECYAALFVPFESQGTAVVSDLDQAERIGFRRPEATDGCTCRFLLDNRTVDASVRVSRHMDQECPAGGAPRKIRGGREFQTHSLPVHACSVTLDRQSLKYAMVQRPDQLPWAVKKASAASAAVMTPVANHPIARNLPDMANLPMTDFLWAISIMIARTGTATAPLITAAM